jgi:hypothetical protein
MSQKRDTTIKGVNKALIVMLAKARFVNNIVVLT